MYKDIKMNYDSFHYYTIKFPFYLHIFQYSPLKLPMSNTNIQKQFLFDAKVTNVLLQTF